MRGAHTSKLHRTVLPPAIRSIRRPWTVLLLWLVICVPALGETVYLNDAGQFPSIHSALASSLLGDEVTLAGTARTLTEISIGFRGDFLDHGLDGDEFVQVTLYENDGPSGEPGTAFFQSDLLPITSPDATTEPQIFTDRLVLPLPNVLAPDSFTWAVNRFGMTNGADTVGLLLGGTPSIGSSGNYVWISHSPGTWIQSPGNQANYDAEIIAIPEPSTAMFFFMILAGISTRVHRAATRSS